MMIPARDTMVIAGGALGFLLLLGSVGPASAQQTRPGTVFQECEACPEMVVVPPGSFMMGSPRTPRGMYTDERPRHRATIGYLLAVGVFEVTFAEWDECVSGGGCDGYRPDDEGMGRERQPVINVSWEDAQGYVAWLSEQTGEVYRLLSETEWEYVARAGTESAWPWARRLLEQPARSPALGLPRRDTSREPGVQRRLPRRPDHELNSLKSVGRTRGNGPGPGCRQAGSAGSPV